MGSGIFWGFVGLLTRLLYVRGFDAAEVLILRYGVATVLFALQITVQDFSLFKIKPKDLWCILGMSLAGMTAMTYFNNLSLHNVSVSVATVLTYTGPIFCMLMATVVFKDGLTLRSGVALCVCFLRLVSISGMGNDDTITILGFIFGLFSGFLGGTYKIFLRYSLNCGYDSRTISFYSVLFASLGGLIFLKNDNEISLTVSTVDNALLVLTLGVIDCFIPTLMYTYSMTEITPERASILNNGTPITSVLLSQFWLKEPLSNYSILEIIIVIAAMIILETSPKK